MWLGDHLSAASAAAEGANDSIIVMVGGVIVAALGVLGAVLTEVVRGRNSRTTPSPPSVAATVGNGRDVELYERTAVLSSRADDSDHRDDVQDRRLERSDERHERSDDRHHQSEWRLHRIERHLGIHDNDSGAH